METLTSSVEASIESGSDTGPFEYTHEYSRDYGLTWIPVPKGMTVGDLKAINNGDIEVRAIPAIKPLNWIGEYDVPQVHPYDGELSDYVPQSDPNEPLPYEIHDVQLNSDGTIEKVSDAEDYKVLSCGFGASGYSPGGVSWIPPDAQQERKAKWRKRFHMKGRKNV